MLSTFNRLLSILQQHPNYLSTPFRPQTPIEIQVGIVIHRLAIPLGYRQLEQMFGVSQGSVAYFTERFIEAILDTLPAYVVGVCIIKDPRFFCFLGIAKKIFY